MEDTLTPEENNLTPKELLFVNYYLTNGLNATYAAKMAGYSSTSAYELGHRLLKKVEVKKVIDQYLKNESMETHELLKLLSDTAKNKAIQFVNMDGTVDLQAIKDNGLMHLVKSVRKGKGGKIYVTFYDAQKAQDTLAKIHKLVTDGMNVTVNVNDEIEKHNELSQKLTDLRNKIIPEGTEMSLQEYLAYFSTTKGTNNATNHQ